MPPDVNVYDTKQASAAETLAERWHTADLMRTGSQTPNDLQASTVADWPPSLKTAFLQRLAQFAGLSKLHANTTRKMNELYGFDAVRHPEVRTARSRARRCQQPARSRARRCQQPCPHSASVMTDHLQPSADK
jgi:hypothetical protein